MSVERIPLEIPPARIPRHLEVLLEETAGPLAEWQGHAESQPFVPADYVLVFDALCALRPRMEARHPRFLEWGSGLGIVTLLASALGWRAGGIEIQPGLVRESRRIGETFGFPAVFQQGSFFPSDANVVETLASTCQRADLLYVYPWPDQELEIFDLFDRLAKPGAWFLTYYGTEDVRIFRKRG